MQKFPLVSIPIYTYNNFEFIFDAIDSVLKQSYPNIELIISDDGSKKFPKKEIEQVLRSAPKQIKKAIIRQNPQNYGTVKHINEVVKIAEGEYFVALAGDDEFNDSDVVNDVVNFFIGNKRCLVLTGKRDIYDNKLIKKQSTLPVDKDLDCLIAPPFNQYEKLVQKSFISGSCTYFSKEFFLKFGLFDERYFLIEDYSKYLSITRQNERIWFYDRVLIKYREGGISNKPNIKYLLDKIEIIKNEILPFSNDIPRSIIWNVKKEYCQRIVRLCILKKDWNGLLNYISSNFSLCLIVMISRLKN